MFLINESNFLLQEDGFIKKAVKGIIAFIKKVISTIRGLIESFIGKIKGLFSKLKGKKSKGKESDSEESDSEKSDKEKGGSGFMNDHQERKHKGGSEFMNDFNKRKGSDPKSTFGHNHDFNKKSPSGGFKNGIHNTQLDGERETVERKDNTKLAQELRKKNRITNNRRSDKNHNRRQLIHAHSRGNSNSQFAEYNYKRTDDRDMRRKYSVDRPNVHPKSEGPTFTLKIEPAFLDAARDRLRALLKGTSPEVVKKDVYQRRIPDEMNLKINEFNYKQVIPVLADLKKVSEEISKDISILDSQIAKGKIELSDERKAKLERIKEYLSDGIKDIASAAKDFEEFKTKLMNR